METPKLKLFLEQVQQNDIEKLLNQFPKKVVFKGKQFNDGLTTFDSIPANTCYVFPFPA